jgi:hypothetical protein
MFFVCFVGSFEGVFVRAKRREGRDVYEEEGKLGSVGEGLPSLARSEGSSLRERELLAGADQPLFKHNASPYQQSQ